jgi:hypothetical protein
VTHLMLKAAEDGEEAVAWAENHREWQRIKTTCDAQEGPRIRGEACTARRGGTQDDRSPAHRPSSGAGAGTSSRPSSATYRQG